MDVKGRLLRLADADYRAFHLRLIPGVPPESVLGVRVPAIRALAKSMTEEERLAFLGELPHEFYDENMLHSVILSGMRGFSETLPRVKEFLPHIDNWAVCDALSPKCFAKESSRVRDFAYECLEEERFYTVRFGVNCLRSFCLDGDAYRAEVLGRVAGVGGEYYLDMAAAWFFCDALIKRGADALPFFEEGRLSREVHVKAVQKACDSFRVPFELKRYLRTLPPPERSNGD